ncbi:N-acetylglucosamine-6-sulfatase isoform X1 [Aplysia californica]|uniref:N-acetylglucosamine-6-sulfatase isoform X1 n=1 Tax=Aplysia californica TaxID=6500 RepID=A0ABM0K0F3_APLCA|nr:N-acetylglucosamine-6-sulfatase isoform X1 [Aplysia californica]
MVDAAGCQLRRCSKMSSIVLYALLFFTLSVTVSQSKQPNIVFVLTDDQDVALFGYSPMPKAKALIGDVGKTFTNMFVSSPLCCPSRSSILTGKYVHNHLASNNSLTGNCSSPSWQKGPEQEAFPVYLKKSGYKTFFSGKYLNQYGQPGAGGVEHIPPGWDDWHGLVGNSRYYNYSLSVNGKEEKHGDDYKSDYLTDIIHRRALDFLNKQNGDSPFFLMLSTPACHEPFDSAPQFLKNFTGDKAPRTKHFNIHGTDKHWLIEQTITPMPNDTITMIDDYFRSRWRTLLSVDDMIEGVVNKLKAMGELDNTYIFFSSDNGYHLGQFSLPYDKRQLYDFDIRVPLMVRGPNITANSTSQETVVSIDLAPTFLEIGQTGQSPSGFDGMSILKILETETSGLTVGMEDLTPSFRLSAGLKHEAPPHTTSAAEETNDFSFRNSFLIEYFGEHMISVFGCPQYKNEGMYNCDAHCVCEDAWNNTYGCIRYETQKESYKYCALQDHANFVEVYDMKNDPYELKNIAKTAPPELLTKLSEELANLSLCSGATCHKKMRSLEGLN